VGAGRRNALPATRTMGKVISGFKNAFRA